MLLRMQNTPRLPDNVQFTNHYPNVNQDVILPSTATLVEVPEASPSYPSPAQTSTFHPPPRTVQQRAPQQPQWTVQPQHPQTHPSSNSTFQSRAPPPVNRPPPQYSTVPPQRQIPVDNQRGQNVPRVNGYVHQNSPGPHGQPFYNPPTWSTATTHVQQPSQPWIRYDQARQGMSQQNAAAVYGTSGALLACEAPPTIADEWYGNLGPEYTTQPPELHNPQQAISGSLPSGSEYSAWPPQPAPRFPTRTNPPQAPSANAQNQSRNLPPRVASSQQAQVQPPPRQHRVGQPSGQPNLTEPHSRPHPHTGAPQPATVAHPRQQPQQPPQALSQPSTEGPSTLKSAPVSHPSQTQPLQGRKTQPTNGPSQVPQTKSHPQSTSSQDQLSQQAVRAGHPLFASKAAFIEGFQRCVQLGPGPVKDFCNKACAAGITREWLEAAIETIPRPIWQSLLAQIRQTGNPDSQSQPVASEPTTSAISTPIAPVVSKLPLPSTNPPVETTNAGVQGERITVPLGITHSVQGQPMIPYAMAAHTKFYADEATRMALAAQGVKIPTTQPGTTPPVPTTPDRDPSRTNVNPRTPLQADKKRLARDILRSLGRAIPKLGPNNAGQPMNEANVQQDEHEKAAVQSRSEAVPLETVPLKVPSVSSKPSTPAAISVPATSSSVLGAAPVSPTKLLVPKTELVPPKQGQPTSVTAEAPITIDLTLDDSDESVDQQGPKPTFPIRTPAAFVMSRPASPINTVTTTHTPQLESLSLAETHVEAEIGAPDVDVRMESPPLALGDVVEDFEQATTFLAFSVSLASVVTPFSGYRTARIRT
ncbi:hypothetical protein BDN67DRAFT_326581 [Paxillus ammoniavirescens]|nr:hypothetical protein BDN67DRAFT_326581 [Paxillus ammoniavirescens]